MTDAPLTQRDADAMTAAIRELTTEMRALPDKIAETYVRKDVLDAVLKVVDTRLTAQGKSIETHSGYFTWATRIVLGLVIVGMVTLLFASGGVHGT